MIPSLAPLTCPRCGAPVPLGSGDQAPCLHCGTSVEIPAPYRELHDASRADRAAREQAARLYAVLGRGPGPFARLVGRVFNPYYWWAVGFPVSGIGWAMLVGLGLPVVLGVGNITEVLRPRELNELIALPWAFFVGAATVAGLHGRRRLVSREGLRAALAARPPETPGGASLCRICGAPLALGPGALGARCDYCGADSLIVQVDPRLAAAARVDRSKVARSVQQAEVQLRQEHRRTLLACGAWGFAALFMDGMLALIAFGEPENRRWAQHPPLRALREGSAVEVEWKGTYYRATVLAVTPDGRVRVHYVGWPASWDETVNPDRVRR